MGVEPIEDIHTLMTHTHIVLPEFPVQRQEVVRYLLKSSSNTHYVYIS